MVRRFSDGAHGNEGHTWRNAGRRDGHDQPLRVLRGLPDCGINDYWLFAPRLAPERPSSRQH